MNHKIVLSKKNWIKGIWPKEVWPKEIWIGWFSSAIEAYNMALYGFAAPLLATKLFQTQDAAAVLFFSYALVFIAAGLFYPLGALYFGAMGDREGRQKICVYSTLGLALATAFLGITPFVEGGWIAFLFFICGQYFFSGGEYYSSIVFALEHAGPSRGGLLSALSCLFAVFGIACANAFVHLSGGIGAIRICFILGGLGGILSYFLKNYCRETPPFAAMPRNQLVRWPPFIRSDWRKIVSGVLLLGFFWVSYTFIFFVLPLLPLDTAGQFDTFKSLLAYGAMLVIAGGIADRWDIRLTILAGLSLFGFAGIPLLAFCTSLLPIQLILTACACLAIGPVHTWLLGQFAVESRCRGIFLCYALSAALFAGSTVPICLLLFDWSRGLILPALYPTLIAFSAWNWLVWNHSKAFQKQMSAP